MIQSDNFHHQQQQQQRQQQQFFHPNDFDLLYSPTSTESSSMQQSSSFTNILTKPSDVKSISKSSDREVILFPTYAMRNPHDPSQWIVQTKGWALSHNISATKQKVYMGFTKNFAGEASADRPASDLFEQRFKYFMAKNKRNKDFVIHADGATSLDERMQDYMNDEENPIDNLVSDDNNSDEPLLPPQPLNARRSSAGSNDSGFQSSSADDDNEKKLTDDFYYIDNNSMMDPLLTLRPGNPLSAVLDRSRRSYSNSTTSLRSSSDSSSGNSSDVFTFSTTTDESYYYHSDRFHAIVGSLESSSSSTTSSVDENINTDSPGSSSTNSSSLASSSSSTSTGATYHTKIKTESTGFMSGEIMIPDHEVQAWAKEHDQCTTRIIRLRAQASTFKPAFGHVSLVEPKGISIISDIDDTIKDTQILAGARTVLSNTFFKPSRDVPGMADAYMHWYNQGASFHYVSNSPFQLMPMLDRFLKTCGFPPGSMHLRLDGSILARLVEVPGRAKRDAILRILKDFPQRQFVLIGDSGEIDLEIYAGIAAEYPDRILKIFIRDVSSSKKKDDQQQQQQQLARRNTFSTMTSMFTPNKNNNKRPPNSVNSNDIEGRRAATLGDMASISSVSLQSKVAKAKQQCHVDIVVFQDAEILRSDPVIRDALWNSLDEQP